MTGGCVSFRDDKMTYAIVEFLGEQQVEVVPTRWIDDAYCVWPDHVKGDRAVIMVKKNVAPDASWARFQVSVKGLFATYEQARKKLNRSEMTSDLGSDADAPLRKRVRRRPQQWSDSEEAAVLDLPTPQLVQNLPRLPDNFPRGSSSGQASSAAASNALGGHQYSQDTVSADLDVTGDVDSLASSCSGTDYSSLSGNGPEGGKMHGHRDPQDAAFRQNVLRLLNVIRFTLQQHGDMLNQLCEVIPQRAIVTCAPMVERPFTALDDLRAFDECLDKDKAGVLVQELIKLGGKDSRTAARRMLGYLLDDKLASLFSWFGRKGKMSFSTLKIAAAVTVAAHSITNEDKAKVEDAIRAWLRHAPERMAAKIKNARASAASVA